MHAKKLIKLKLESLLHITLPSTAISFSFSLTELSLLYQITQFRLLPHHLEMMNINTNMTTLLSSSSWEGYDSQSFIFRQLHFMHHVQIVELVVALFVFIAIYSLRQKKRHGLPVWPVLGMLPSMVMGIQTDMYEFISEVVCRQNGTFQFKGPWFSSLKCVITSDPRNLEHLLKTKFQNFPKGQYFRDTLQDLLGDGIFNADDETWQRQRKTASIEFHSTKFRHLTTESLLELVHCRLIPVLEESMKQAGPIDLQDVLLRLLSLSYYYISTVTCYNVVIGVLYIDQVDF